MRPTRIFCLALILAGASPVACSDDKKPEGTASGTDAGSGAGGATAGAGGSTGVGGSGTAGAGGSGAGGTGAGGATAGAGGSGVPSTGCMIPCIVELTKDCLPSGACMEQSAALIGSSNRCYANGVKVISTIDITSMPPSFSSTYKKANGSLCYTLEAAFASPAVNLTWKDSTGKTVATGSLNTTTQAVSGMCTGGASFDAAQTAACASTLSLPTLPGVQVPGASACPAGTCMP